MPNKLNSVKKKKKNIIQNPEMNLKELIQKIYISNITLS